MTRWSSLCFIVAVLFANIFLSRQASNCIDMFCPPDSFCDERVGPCVTPPCATILVCVPNEANGCARHSCPADEVCVERVRPCIGRSCKKLPSCAKPGTCDAMVCGPSQRCISDPSPHCIKWIPTVSQVIGKAILVEPKKTL